MAFAGVFAGTFFLTGCNSSLSQPENQGEISESATCQAKVDYAKYIQNVDGNGYSTGNGVGAVTIKIKASRTATSSLGSSKILAAQSTGSLTINFTSNSTSGLAAEVSTTVTTGYLFSKYSINGIEYTITPTTVAIFMASNGVSQYLASIDLEIYYDRVQYSLSLDSNNGTFDDGTTTKQLSLYYQQGLSVVSPTKYGYEFCGWIDDNGNEYDTSTFAMPASNLNLHAVWEPIKSIVRLDTRVEQ